MGQIKQIKAHSLKSLIGNTPLVCLTSMLDSEEVQLYAKLEGQNPGGSVKDRAALSMIEGALERGEIGRETTVIEATSGNTGIALAMICAEKGIKLELIMPEHATIERVKTMRAYGAKVILTATEKGIEGSRDYAKSQVSKGNYLLLDQFSNDDNWRAHYVGTGPEIWRDTRGQITHFVSAMGTTGTIMGTSRYLKEQNREVQIVGAQPEEGSKIPGIRRWPEQYLPTIFNAEDVDRTLDVSQTEAETMALKLAQKHGLFVGISSGGAVHLAKKVAEELSSGMVVVIICDRGDRYLSAPIYS